MICLCAPFVFGIKSCVKFSRRGWKKIINIEFDKMRWMPSVFFHFVADAGSGERPFWLIRSGISSVSVTFSFCGWRDLWLSGCPIAAEARCTAIRATGNLYPETWSLIKPHKLSWIRYGSYLDGIKSSHTTKVTGGSGIRISDLRLPMPNPFKHRRSVYTERSNQI